MSARACSVLLLAALACGGEPAGAGASSSPPASSQAVAPLASSQAVATPAGSASASAAAAPDPFATDLYTRSATPAQVRAKDEAACEAGDAPACRQMADRYRGYGAPAGCGLERGRARPFSKRTASDTIADDAMFVTFIAKACDAKDADACLLERAARAQSVWNAKDLELQLTRTSPSRSGLARFVDLTRPDWTRVIVDERAQCMTTPWGCWSVGQILLKRTDKLDPKKPPSDLLAGVQRICAETAECDSLFMMLDKYGFDAAALAQTRAAAAKSLSEACLAGDCVCGQAARFVDETSPEHLALSQLGCENGEAEGCYGLARRLEAGAGVARDARLARRLYELACPSMNPIGERDGPRRGEHSPRACDRLAELHEGGEMPPKDESRALHYAQLACSHAGAEVDHAPCVRLSRYWATSKRNTGRNGEDARLSFRKKDECQRPSVRALCEKHEKEVFSRP